MDMEKLRALLQSLAPPGISLNFYFTANQKTYKIKVNPKEPVWKYLYRFNENQKELTGMVIFSVIHKDKKLSVDMLFNDTDIEEGDTITIESELTSKESEADKVRKNCIKPYGMWNSEKNLIGLYEGDLKSGIPDGNGRYFHIMGFFYKGEWKEGIKEGKGIECVKEGEVYEGEFKNDKRNGKGKLHLYDGEVYEGDWLDDKKDGKGKIVYPNGDIYEGDFKNGLPNGKGIIKWIGGCKYEGEMKNDLMEGKGVYTYSNGDVYEGEMKGDKKNGKGILRYIDGDIYEGDFVNNQKTGKGIYKFSNGDVYEGEFLNNKLSGKGIFKYSNGNKYEGEFMGGVKEGFGKMTYHDGKIEDGLFENDQFVNDFNAVYSFELNCIKTLNNPHKAVNVLLQLKDGRLISCSEDGTLVIYKKDSYEIDLSIKEHSDEIYSTIQLNDERLVTCSKDKTLKIIKLTADNKYVVEATLESHEDEVINVVETKNNEIISISSDKTMKVWDLNNFKNTKTIENDCDNIFKLSEQEFVTSSEKNKCLKFWNFDNLENTKTIKDLKITSFTQSICLLEDNILLIGGSGIIYSINTKNYEIINNFELSGLILSIKKSLDGNILCTIFNGNKNNHIIKFKYEQTNLTKLLEKRKASNNPIFNCIQLNNGIIVSAEGRRNADSYEIKFWEIKEKTK